MDQFAFGEEIRRKTVRRLLKRYGEEIWSYCMDAGGYDPDNGPMGLNCLTGLELSRQVYNQPTFEEFLVRNALKSVAKELLENRRVAPLQN